MGKTYRDTCNEENIESRKSKYLYFACIYEEGTKDSV